MTQRVAPLGSDDDGPEVERGQRALGVLVFPVIAGTYACVLVFRLAGGKLSPQYVRSLRGRW